MIKTETEVLIIIMVISKVIIITMVKIKKDYDHITIEEKKKMIKKT